MNEFVTNQREMMEGKFYRPHKVLVGGLLDFRVLNNNWIFVGKTGFWSQL